MNKDPLISSTGNVVTNKENLLILGGTNFIGPYLVDFLLKSNKYNIFMLNRSGNNLNNNKITCFKCDRNDFNTLSNIIENIKLDIVVDMCLFNLKQAENIYTILTKKSIKKYIFLSSIASYEHTHKYPLIESNKLGEWTLFGTYGINKMECENFIKSKNNFPYVILKPTYILGKNNYIYREQYYFDKIKNNEPLLIDSDGNAILQFVFVEDVAQILFLSILNDDIINESINICNDDLITIHYLIKLIEDKTSKKTIIKNVYDENNNEIPFKNNNIIISNSKSKDIFNFKYKSIEFIIDSFTNE
jgi:dTDP-glucose 4,6-dehydratase